MAYKSHFNKEYKMLEIIKFKLFIFESKNIIYILSNFVSWASVDKLVKDKKYLDSVKKTILV